MSCVLGAGGWGSGAGCGGLGRKRIGGRCVDICRLAAGAAAAVRVWVFLPHRDSAVLRRVMVAVVMWAVMEGMGGGGGGGGVGAGSGPSVMRYGGGVYGGGDL